MLTLIILTIVGVHSTIGVVVTPIAGPYNNLTDSSFWSEETQSFYWSDYWTFGNQPSIFRYDYLRQKVYSAYIEGKTETAYLVPVKQCGKYRAINNNLFLSGSLHENYLISWNGIAPKATVIETVFRIEADNPASHMDLGAQNRVGKFIVGTTNNVYCLGDANRSLYSYTKASGVDLLYTGFKSTAGLVFRGNKIYHNDVCRQKIEVLERDISGECNVECCCVEPKHMTHLKRFRELNFVFHCSNGIEKKLPKALQNVSNIVYDFAASNPGVLPSGLEIDEDGLLYTTGYGSGTVWQINPATNTATLITSVPTKYVTAVGFGGPKRDILYLVASSVLFNSNLDVVDFAKATPLYAITGLGARGVPSQKMSC